MLPIEQGGVVDPNLLVRWRLRPAWSPSLHSTAEPHSLYVKVYGTTNIRVADASFIPLVCSLSLLTIVHSQLILSNGV